VIASALSSLRARPPLAAALLVLAVLLATTDERSFGVVPDGQEMLSAGAAIAFRGELGVSRDFANAVPREGGDAFSRYGTGQSLALVPFLWAARALHAVAPGLPSSPVLVLLPLLALVAAAWGAARAAASLGASPGGQLLAGAGLVLATPLWGYAGSDFSEPLQAAVLSLGVASLAASRTAPSRPLAIASGALLGALPLVKSVLWIVAAPLLLAGLLQAPPAPESRARRRGRGGAAPPQSLLLAFVASAAVPALLWLALEVLRFGRPFGGYGGETFSYPLVAGLARLTVFPNKGLLFYAPVVLLSVPGLLLLRRRDPRLSLALAAACAAVLVSSATWWAWDGQAAWGPRLLVPALPLLLVAAGLAVDGSRTRRALAAAFVLAGFAANGIGAIQPFPPVYVLAGAARPQPIDPGRAEGTPYEIGRGPDGILVATGPHHLSLTPGWWPPLVHARLLAARFRGGDVLARVRADGLGLRPPLELPPAQPRAASLAEVAPPFTWPFWGRAFGAPPPGLVDPLSKALVDQAVRDLDVREPRRARQALAVVLARRSSPEPRTLALAAEAATRAGEDAEARALLDRSPEPCHPWVLFVRVERREDVASCVPQELADGFLSGVRRSLSRGEPVSAWARESARRGGAGR
jgi:hypothetical protein